MKKAMLNEYALNGYTVNSNLPIGAPMAWLSDVLPVGFLAFDGAEYNQTDFPELYNVVKNIPAFHSETEGKFKIPNLKGRVLQGADTVIGELIEAGLPNITGNVQGVLMDDGGPRSSSGALKWNGSTRNRSWQGSDGSAMYNLSFNAKDGETKTDGTIKTEEAEKVFGKSDTVQSPAFTVRWIIKATQYASLEQNAIDDTCTTNANAWSAEQTNNALTNSLKINPNGIIEDNFTLAQNASHDYIALSNGFYYITGTNGNTSGIENRDFYVYLNDVLLFAQGMSVNYLGHYPAIPIPLRKGDKISIKRLTSDTGVNFTNRFIPTFI